MGARSPIECVPGKQAGREAGASAYCYAESCRVQGAQSRFGSRACALGSFGGGLEILVPDDVPVDTIRIRRPKWECALRP